MLYQFRCGLTEEQFYELYYFLSFETPKAKKALRIRKILVPAFFFVIWLFLWYLIGFSEYLLKLFVLFALYTLLYLAYIALYPKFFFKRRFNKLKKQGKLRNSLEGDMRFYDEYFVSESKVDRYELRYDGITDLFINEGKAIYLIHNRSIAFALSFSVFKSMEERAEFIKFIKDKTG